jgi:ATP-binding protein involved in chromosome partitioning
MAGIEKVYVQGVGKVIGVASGKGGVGKSTVAVLLAQALASKGNKVGVLDADITGPSLPRLLGLEGRRGEAEGERLRPLVNAEGIKLLSINLYSEGEDDPIIWRGPMLASALQQFWSQSDWGELDYLVVDFPPSTSDVTLTAFQTMPFAGVFIVATPQDYVSMIVRKSINMARALATPVLGVVENMRSLICPKCGEEIALFDDGLGASQDRLGIPLVVSLPWRREVAQAKSLSWANLGQSAKEDALKIAARAEAAQAPEPSQAEGCGGGCECGSSSCCDSCGSAPGKE